MKLSDYAKLKGVTYRTAWNWYNANKIPNAEQMDNGTIIINSNIIIPKIENVVLYARVSSYKQKDDLERQLSRLREYANSNGYIIKKEHKEICSGINDNRNILNKILLDSSNKVIIVENKNILTRFGFNYIKNLLHIQDRTIIVMNESSLLDDDLKKDICSLITSFCCKIYGTKIGLNKAKEMKNILQ